MKKWKVILESFTSEHSDDLSFVFVDLKELIGKYLGVSGQILAYLKNLVSTYMHYNAVTQIKRVTDYDTNKEFSGTFFTLMGLDKQNGLDFGFLFLFTNKGLGIIAMFPEESVINLKGKEDTIKSILSSMLQKPDYWETVNLYLPVQGSD